MIPAERFALLDTQRQSLFQPDCPVYVHCTRRSVARDSGDVFLQVRMVNCAEREISTVFLCVEGLDSCGQVCYQVRELPIADCAAAPHRVFGENHLLVLPRTKIASLRVTVERVIFADGTRWRRQPEHRLCSAQEAGRIVCACGLPNPPQRERCLLCERPLVPVRETNAEEPTAFKRPAPIVRDFTPRAMLEEDSFEKEEARMPRWQVVVLCLFRVAAIAAVTAFLVFCLMRDGN